MNFSNGLMDNNKPSEKLLSMICNLSVSPSIMILPMDLLTTKTRKKIYSSRSIVQPIYLVNF